LGAYKRREAGIVKDMVTYTVVVRAPNLEGALLPGMTATVSGLVSDGNDTAVVRGSDRRAFCAEGMIPGFSERIRKMDGALPDPAGQRDGARMAGIVGSGGLPVAGFA
jgi:hypothetical protein